jgi:thioredoxin domain-containing protein 5
MNSKVLALVCLLVACAFSEENDIENNEEEVADSTINLTDDNFEGVIQTNNFFVMFHAPWCQHCVKLKPTWNQLAEMLNTQEESRVRIAKVDCTENHKTCSDNEVTSYPTLKYFNVNAEQPVKYRSTRDLPSLTAFINEQLGTTTLKETEEEEAGEEQVVPSPLKGLIELNDKNFGDFTAKGSWFIKFYAPWCGHCQRLAPIWNDLATALEHDESVNIAKVDCTEYRPLCKDFDVKGYPTLLWIEDSKKVDKYSGPRTVEDLKAYVENRLASKGGEDKQKEEEKPAKEATEEGEGDVVVALTADNFPQVIKSDVTFVKFYAPWCGHCKRMQPTWQQLALKFVGDEKVKIGKVDCTLTENRDLCSEQDVQGFPTIFIYKNGEKITEYNGNRSLEDMFDFVKSHLTADKSRDEL